MFKDRKTVVINNETRGGGIRPTTPLMYPHAPPHWRGAGLVEGEDVIDIVELGFRKVYITNLRVAYFSSSLSKRVILDIPHDRVDKWVTTFWGGSVAHLKDGTEEVIPIDNKYVTKFHKALDGLVAHENHVNVSSGKRGGCLGWLLGV